MSRAYQQAQKRQAYAEKLLGSAIRRSDGASEVSALNAHPVTPNPTNCSLGEIVVQQADLSPALNNAAPSDCANVPGIRRRVLRSERRIKMESASQQPQPPTTDFKATLATTSQAQAAPPDLKTQQSDNVRRVPSHPWNPLTMLGKGGAWLVTMCQDVKLWWFAIKVGAYLCVLFVVFLVINIPVMMVYKLAQGLCHVPLVDGLLYDCPLPPISAWYASTLGFQPPQHSPTRVIDHTGRNRSLVSWDIVKVINLQPFVELGSIIVNPHEHMEDIQKLVHAREKVAALGNTMLATRIPQREILLQTCGEYTNLSKKVEKDFNNLQMHRIFLARDMIDVLDDYQTRIEHVRWSHNSRVAYLRDKILGWMPFRKNRRNRLIRGFLHQLDLVVKKLEGFHMPVTDLEKQLHSMEEVLIALDPSGKAAAGSLREQFSLRRMKDLLPVEWWWVLNQIIQLHRFRHNSFKIREELDTLCAKVKATRTEIEAESKRLNKWDWRSNFISAQAVIELGELGSAFAQMAEKMRASVKDAAQMQQLI